MMIMNNMNKKLLSLGLLLLPVAAFAHPGHEFFNSEFLTGMIHPWTGLDHMLMAAGLGLLMTRCYHHAGIQGLGMLLGAIFLGFGLGMLHIIPADSAELGISASLAVLATTLWIKSKAPWLMLVGILGMFHGAAHGALTSPDAHWFGFLAGLTLSTTVLYGIGLFAGRLMKHYFAQRINKRTERVVAVIAGAVAVIGLG
jgi:urease accessory protein